MHELSIASTGVESVLKFAHSPSRPFPRYHAPGAATAAPSGPSAMSNKNGSSAPHPESLHP
jgi:hypothetical protein